jgi:hypothetical protein
MSTGDKPGASERAVSRSVYRPPTGFGGYSWNTPLREFRRLVPDPVYVRIAYSQGTISEFDVDCFMDGGYTLACAEVNGLGYHALAEYYVDSQGFRLKHESPQPKREQTSSAPAKTVLFPITYQFCAQWNATTSNVKGDMLELMELCGVRLHFRSETELEQKGIRDPDYVTGARRVLDWLIDNHGVPEKYVNRGSVSVIGVDTKPEAVKERETRFDNWFWCSPQIDAVAPDCDASIVYTFDSETGRGQVIYLTPEVWTYAHARRYGGAEDDPLYRILHGNIKPPSVRHICTGSFLCDPPAPKPMPEKMLARFRLKTADTAGKK